MTILPSLEELLSEPFALILGAGSSMDYGFPSWKQLEGELIARLNDSSGPVVNFFAVETVKGFLTAIETMSHDETIDTIAERFDDEKFKLFQLLTASILIKCESDSKAVENGWVEIFLSKMVDLFEYKIQCGQDPQDIFANLHIITLNYDRLFEHRFMSKIDESIRLRLKRSRHFEQKGYEKLRPKIGPIIHPHGAIATMNDNVDTSCSTYLNKNGNLGIEYGDEDALVRGFKHFQQVPYICPVDDITQADENPSYNEANAILKKVSSALCLGLSQAGIKDSNLELDTIERVYTSDKSKLSDNFISLGKYARPLFESLLVKP